MTPKKVAIITGGASGFGFGVGAALVKRGDWNVHLFDRNVQTGEAASSNLGAAAIFYQVDVTEYRGLAEAFQKVFKTEGRLDFVFANAGIVESAAFYEQHVADQIPPEPDLTTIDINFKAVWTTSYLALNYFRRCPAADKNLVLTASTAGLYPSILAPTYSSTKHGVVGLMRAIARGLMKEGIRCNAICPGLFRTGLLDGSMWDTLFAPETVGDPSSVVGRVLQLVDGGELIDSVNKRVTEVYGQTVEIILDQFYLREQPIYSNAAMAKTAGVRNLENMKFL